ncbi:response regulator [candidate division KSB1 bacterium]|nr:response regulator [candidate division KSB1 bacterium]
MKQLRTLIIDDEWLIRIELKRMLMHYPNINVVGEATNMIDALKIFNELKPELVFLDIQLPGGTGFDFLNRVSGDFKVVFITAYNQLHDEAKKYQAMDYLMKPISKAKLAKVIQKL